MTQRGRYKDRLSDVGSSDRRGCLRCRAAFIAMDANGIPVRLHGTGGIHGGIVWIQSADGNRFNDQMVLIAKCRRCGLVHYVDLLSGEVVAVILRTRALRRWARTTGLAVADAASISALDADLH